MASEVLDGSASLSATEKANLIKSSNFLSKLAQRKLFELIDERPNDVISALILENQRELLKIFSRGFEGIALAGLEAAQLYEEGEVSQTIRHAVDRIFAETQQWWNENSQPVPDWIWRFPMLASESAALGFSGIDVTVATSAALRLFEGEKAIEAIKEIIR